MKVCALFTGGKDSTYSAFLASKTNELVCLVNGVSENADSYMFHTVGSNIVELQSAAIGVPLERFHTRGEKEFELADLKACIKSIKDRYGVEGVVSGALASEYQYNRIGKLLSELGLKSVTPLWHTDVYSYLTKFIKEGFKAVMVSVSADGLDESWLLKELNNENLEKLSAMSKKYKFHLGFEGGEAETAVLDGPNFLKRITITDYEILHDGPKHYVKIKNAGLENKV